MQRFYLKEFSLEDQEGAIAWARLKSRLLASENCASSLVQGINKYVEIPTDEEIPGVMHNTIGDYRIEDIEVVAAFDIDENKVGKGSIRSYIHHTEQYTKVCRRPTNWSNSGTRG
ncbi:MAG: hypothetical protein CM1200mP15_16730 [Dehalococcoidia bacterium]|nr:MAG: hypothetical protein CM1200mP15_16730 [Dehalococcoidia bacterium]